MIKEFIKFIFILLTFIVITTLVPIKYPNFIGFMVNKISDYKINISNLDIDYKDKKISINSKSVIVNKLDNRYVFDNLQIVVNFENLYNPQTSLKIKTLDIAVNNKTSANSSNKLPLLPAKIVIDKINLNYLGLQLTTRLQVESIAGKTLITGSIDKINIAKNLQYLHLIPNKKTYKYLKQSLKYGDIANLNYNILIDDNFALNINGKLTNGYIKFHPEWESVDNINAKFNINNSRLVLNLDNAKIAKIIATGEVEVNWDDELFIKVDIKSSSNTKIVTDFLKISPLPDKLITALGEINATGEVDATVDLYLPIGSATKTSQIIINANLINNTVLALNDKLQITKINAILKYDKFLSINGTGNIFGKNSDISLVYKNNLYIDINNAMDNFKISNVGSKWLIDIVNNNAIGNISIDTSKTPFLVKINSFNFKSTDSKSATANININSNDISNFDLITNNITINNNNLPNFTTSFIRNGNGLNIKDLQFNDIKLNNEKIKFNGIWVDGLISFWTNVTGNKLNDLFESFDINEKTTGGKFNLDIRGFCKCNPWELSLDKISGYANANIYNGTFTEQDPNIGKLLSLLNINSITKRLSLEMGDITNKGFVYDDINIEIILNKNGIATIENFKLDSSSSKINLSGSSNIVNQTYALNAEVIPAIKDSIPIATALAGGNLAGLGIWLIDKVIFKEKLLNAVVGKIANFNYKITGDWDNPQINTL